MHRYLSLLLGALLTVLAPLAVDLGLPTSSALAAEDDEPVHSTRRVPSMSEATYKKLAEAQELIDAKDLQSALSLLTGMLERQKGMNGNEVGQVQNMLGFLYFSLEDYDKAIRAYQQVLAQGENIPEGLEVTTLYTLAQLSFVADKYQQALDYMRQWLAKASNPGPEPHIFMGQVYYQMKDYPNAIKQIETGIDIAKERDIKVKENWWALLNYLYYEREDWPKVLETLEILVTEFPKREYWVRMAGVLGQQGDEKGQVYAMESAYTLGFLDRESDYLTLSGLLMQEQVPIRAAWVMKKGFDDKIIKRTATNLRSYGQALQLAQEVDQAIPVLEEAAKLADDGDIYDRLSQVYLDTDQYENCTTAAQRAIDKGGLRREAGTYLVKGMCQYNMNDLSSARRSFTSCRNTARSDRDETNEDICQKWITYIDREEERRRQLEQAL